MIPRHGADSAEYGHSERRMGSLMRSLSGFARGYVIGASEFHCAR